MTETDRVSLVQALGPIVREYAEKAVRDLEGRVVAAEARVAALGDVRDRVIAMETKAAVTLAGRETDLTALVQRVQSLEARTSERGAPGPPGPSGKDAPTYDINDLVSRVVAVLPKPEPGPPGKDGKSFEVVDIQPQIDSTITKAIAAIPLPKDGRDGLPGQSGLNGKDGRDGSLDQMKMVFDGERTVSFAFKNGDPIDGWTATFPAMIYRGVYQPGTVYELGDTVTYGDLWHCQAPGTVTPPGDASKLWKLCVRRGRDGKDLRDLSGVTVPMPVVRTK